MRYSFVLLGLLAFVCATSGYVLNDQDDALRDTDNALSDTDDALSDTDDALSDTDDLPEVSILEDDDGNRAEDSDDANIGLRRRGSHSREHWPHHHPHTHRRRRTTTIPVIVIGK